MNKIISITILSFLFCGIFFGCTDEKNEARIKSDMIVKMAFPQIYIDGTEDKEIIPYLSLYAESENEEIATVQEFKVVGKSLGKTIINVYENESKANLIKKINVEIIPTAIVDLICGESIIFQDIPEIGLSSKPNYINDFKTSDNGVAIISSSDLITFSIEALMSGMAYIYNTDYSDGDVIVEVNVEKYTGSRPFPLPEGFSYLMDVADVKEKMKDYYLKEEGKSVLFNQKYATTLVYSPFGDAESITMYIGEGLSLSTQYQKNKLLGFKIIPSSSPQTVVSYLLSNYILNTESWASSSIWSGFRTFDSGNGWIIASGADAWSEAWSSIDFYTD